MRKIKKCISFVLCVMLMLMSLSLTAVAVEEKKVVTNDLYVSLNGDDNNVGTSDKPLKTLKKAISLSSELKGASINVGEGTFEHETVLTIPSGTTIIGQGTDKTTIMGVMRIEKQAKNITVSNIEFSGKNRKYNGTFYIRDASNIKMHDVIITQYSDYFIDMQRVQDSEFYNAIVYDTGYSISQEGGGIQSVIITMGNVINISLHDMIIDTLNYKGGKGIGVNCDTWSGAVPWESPAAKLENVKIYNMDIKVNKINAWGNGNIPMCTIELWHADCKNVEIYNCTFNNNVSLAGPNSTKNIRLHHNKWYGPGILGYSLEADIDNLEFDHNYLEGGLYALACFDSNASRKNTNVHHNIFKDQSLTTLVGHFLDKRVNLRFNNNTVYISQENAKLFYFERGQSEDDECKNNLFYSTVKKAELVSKVSVKQNLFFNMTAFGKKPLTSDPMLSLNPNDSIAFFEPMPDSPVIDAGVKILGITDGFVGKAPDIGAIESGAEKMKVGYQGNLKIPEKSGSSTGNEPQPSTKPAENEPQPTPAPTVEPIKQVFLNKITVDGKQLDVDAPPVIINGRMLVPFRAVFKALGGGVLWDESTKTVIAEKGNVHINFQISNVVANVNNKEVILDVPAKIINNMTMVPLRFVAETLGATVEWDEQNSTAKIITKKQ